MDRLISAKVFIDVAYSQSFTATSERLGISRPMVTRHIESMEDWLNVRLLNRTTRKVALTTAGHACLKDVELWLSQAESLSSKVTNGEALSGTIRIATSVSFSYAQMIIPIREFLDIHPNIHIDFDIQDVAVDLLESRIDLAIRISSDPDPTLIGKQIATCDSILAASPKYLRSMPKIETLNDLSEHHCLKHTNFSGQPWTLTHNDCTESVKTKWRFTANDATTLLHAAINNVGICLLPRYLINTYLDNGQLEHVLPEWESVEYKVFALYSSRKHLSPAVRALIDYLDEYFQNDS